MHSHFQNHFILMSEVCTTFLTSTATIIALLSAFTLQILFHFDSRGLYVLLDINGNDHSVAECFRTPKSILCDDLWAFICVMLMIWLSYLHSVCLSQLESRPLTVSVTFIALCLAQGDLDAMVSFYIITCLLGFRLTLGNVASHTYIILHHIQAPFLF